MFICYGKRLRILGLTGSSGMNAAQEFDFQVGLEEGKRGAMAPKGRGRKPSP